MINENILVQTEDESLLRDVHSKALLNKNVQGLNEYRARKKHFEDMKKEKDETKDRLEKLEKDIEEIKNLLIQISSLKR